MKWAGGTAGNETAFTGVSETTSPNGGGSTNGVAGSIHFSPSAPADAGHPGMWEPSFGAGFGGRVDSPSRATSG